MSRHLLSVWLGQGFDSLSLKFPHLHKVGGRGAPTAGDYSKVMGAWTRSHCSMGFLAVPGASSGFSQGSPTVLRTLVLPVIRTTVILPLLPTPNPGLCCLTPPLTASSKTPPSAHFAPKPKLLPSSEASKLPQQPRQNAPLFIRLYQEPLALRDRLYGIKYFSGLAGTLGMLVPHPRTHLSS